MSTIYQFIESAVSLNYIFLTLTLTVVSSLILGIITSAVTKNVIGGIFTFVISELILIAAFFFVRDKVQIARLNEIKKVMYSIEEKNYYPPVGQNVFISSWREGLQLIKKNPTEIGLYLKTVKYLEDEKDYESASSLIGLGLDFMHYKKIPTILCDKLQSYYKHLPNRPKLDKGCKKIHEL